MFGAVGDQQGPRQTAGSEAGGADRGGAPAPAGGAGMGGSPQSAFTRAVENAPGGRARLGPVGPEPGKWDQPHEDFHSTQEYKNGYQAGFNMGYEKACQRNFWEHHQKSATLDTLTLDMSNAVHRAAYSLGFEHGTDNGWDLRGAAGDAARTEERERREQNKGAKGRGRRAPTSSWD